MADQHGCRDSVSDLPFLTDSPTPSPRPSLASSNSPHSRLVAAHGHHGADVVHAQFPATSPSSRAVTSDEKTSLLHNTPTHAYHSSDNTHVHHVTILPSSSSSSSSSSSVLSTLAIGVGIDSSVDVGDGKKDGIDDALMIHSMTYYRSTLKRTVGYWIAAVLTAGLSLLIAYWFPRKAVVLRYENVANVEDAEYVLVDAVHNGFELVPIEPVRAFSSLDEAFHRPRCFGLSGAPKAVFAVHQTETVPMDRRMIVFRQTRFVYNIVTQSFERLRSADTLRVRDVRNQLVRSGLSSDQHNRCLDEYGSNELLIVVPSIPLLLVREVFHPFFVFQVYSVTLWCFEDYYIFASCIAFIAITSIIMTLKETRERMISLAKMAKHDTTVKVLRDGKIQIASSSTLVPGDVVEVETHDKFTCDLVLVQGGCVVNESMLTGESVPVVKSAVDLRSENPHHTIRVGQDQRTTLFAGTQVLQSKPVSLTRSTPEDAASSHSSLATDYSDKVLAVVLRTGFATNKGSLVLSILFPRPSSFRFVTQSFYFVGLLFVVAFIGFAITAYRLSATGAEVRIVLLRALDLITIVVPPSLPLAMSVGTNFALSVLRHQKIFCISPSRINMAGKIKLVCFDKTGTLTSEGMEFMCVLPCSNGRFGRARTATELADPNEDGELIHPHIVAAMACCHSLTVLNKEIIGDPLEQKIFEVTKAKLHDMDSVAHLSCGRVSWTVDSSVSMAESSSVASKGSAVRGKLNPSLARKLKRAPGPLRAHVMHSGGGRSALDDSESESEDSEYEFEAESKKNSQQQQQQQQHQQEHVGDGEICPPLLPPEGLENDFKAKHDNATSKCKVFQHVRVLFEFASELQRMSVVVTDEQSNRSNVYCKGSPEVIQSLCLSSSLPADYLERLSQYAHQGYRVLAVAHKLVDGSPCQQLFSVDDADSMDKSRLRALCECDLSFLGFLVMENKVKSETPHTLQLLRQAHVRCVMVTGDNPLTAVSVAKKSQLVPPDVRVFVSHLVHSNKNSSDGSRRHTVVEWRDSDNPQVKLDPFSLQRVKTNHLNGDHEHDAVRGVLDKKDSCVVDSAALTGPYELAVTGSAFALLSSRPDLYPPELLKKIIISTVVFARMTPFQKATVVTELQHMGLYVAMCGDGANDCAALKAAHVGVSLSEAEASIAAPFTYQDTNISCIPTLLAEGRSSLNTSFNLFRYMAIYSMIQFWAVIILYFKGSVFGNWQYLFQDLFLVFPLTIFMGHTMASKRLSVKRPSGNLLSRSNVLNLFCHTLFCVAILLTVFLLTPTAEGYEDIDNPDNLPTIWETTSVFYAANFQYVVMAALFCLGWPWKTSPVSNIKFSVWWVITLTCCLLVLFASKGSDTDFFMFEDDIDEPMSWRLEIFMVVAVHATLATLFELFVYPRLVSAWKLAKLYSRARNNDVGTVFGDRKLIQGAETKEWHRLRGEFERSCWMAKQ